MNFKESLIARCKDDHWPVIIILINGLTIEIDSDFLIFHADFLEFDRIAAKVNVSSPYIKNSGAIPRFVKIPYSSIALFTDVAS